MVTKRAYKELDATIHDRQMKYPDDFINKIICGDCLEVMKEMPDGCIDLTVTSPPYDNLRDYDGYIFDFRGIAKQLFRVTKIGGVVVWIIGDATMDGSETGTSFKQVLYFKEMGFNIHDTMIYEKDGSPYPSNNRYRQVFEYMFILSKKELKTFIPIKDRKNIHQHSKSSTYRQKDGTLNKIANINFEPFGMRHNIWKYGCGYGKGAESNLAYLHPATFPYKLALDHIKSWSNEGDVILDPLIGSGTTARTAKDLKRNFIGIEINPNYCKIAKERLAQGVL